VHDVRRTSSTNGSMRVVAVLLSAVLLSGCDWFMYRSNAAHTGESLGEKVIGVGNVATLGEAWTTSDDTAVDNVVGQDPVVAGGRLYLQTANGFLSVYDADGIDNCGGSPKQCQPVWKAQTGGGAAPAVVGGVVYHAGAGVLSAYDAAGTAGCSGSPPTCQPLWTASLGADFVASPTVAGGIAYVTGVVFPRTVLVAFDAAGHQGCTGTPKICVPLWTATFGEDGDFNGGGSSPAVANGRVFVPGGDHTVYVFDAAGQQNCSGAPKECSALWTATVPLPCPSSHSPCDISVPAVANGILYVTAEASDFATGAPAGGLYAFDAAGTTSCIGSPKQCSPLWRSITPTLFPPAIANGVVYAVSYAVGEGHRLRAFDAAGVKGCSGAPKICAPLWTSTTDLVPPGNRGLTPSNGLTSAPAVANGVVYIVGIADGSCDIICTVTRHLFAFDGSGIKGCTGTPKRCAPLFDAADPPDVKTFSEPVVANGILYVGDAGLGPEGPAVTVVRAFQPM
jgi:hypothetical protein